METRNRYRQGNLSVALLDVFFNMMVVFMLLAMVSNQSINREIIDVHSRKDQKDSAKLPTDTAIEINYHKGMWKVSIQGKTIVYSSSVKEVIEWLSRAKPDAIKLRILKNEVIKSGDIFLLLTVSEKEGILIYYEG